MSWELAGVCVLTWAAFRLTRAFIRGYREARLERTENP